MSTTLLTGIVETRRNENGFIVTEFMGTGDPAQNAFVETVAACFRDTPPALIFDEPVTFLRYGHTMLGVPLISLEEGRLFLREGYGSTQQIVCLPKGRRTKGYRLQPDQILAVRRGFNQGDTLRVLVDDLVRVLPAVETLTQDDLNALPTRGGTCTLAAVGTSPFYGSNVPGVWLLHSYMPEADIAEGVFVVPDGHGAVTEHGSVYGRELLRRFAKAGSVRSTRLRPWLSGMPLVDALDLTFDRALAAIDQAVTVG